MKRLEIRQRHALQVGVLRARVRDAVRQAHSTYGVDVEEISETRMLLKRGRYLAGSINITDKSICIVLELSWGLQLAADTIEGGVREELGGITSV